MDHQHHLVDADTNSIIPYLRNVLTKSGYSVQNIKVAADNLSNLKKIKADFVFNLVDSRALELKIAKILSRTKLVYSSSDYHSLRKSNNKIKTKRYFVKYKIPTPEYKIIKLNDRVTKASVPGNFPVIIKPAFEHCSIGISDLSIAENYRQFKELIKSQKQQYKQTLIAEEFISGMDLQITVLRKNGRIIALPIAQLSYKDNVPTKWNIYGFEEKWNKDLPIYKSIQFIAPAKGLSVKLRRLIKQDAIRAYRVLGFNSYVRFDLRFNPGTCSWYFLEGNANPGICNDPTDAMTASILAYGMSLDDFLINVVRNGIKSTHPS